MRRKKIREGEKRKKLEPWLLRKKVCRFCKNKDENIYYRDIESLKPFISERGRVMAGRITGNCARHQRMVSRAIKRARELALLPFRA